MRETLDNYRYIEIKNIKKYDVRTRSIVRHKRLGKPKGKESSYEKGRCNTQSYYIPKSSNIHQIQKERKHCYNNKENSKLTTSNDKINNKSYKNIKYQTKPTNNKSNISAEKVKQILTVNYKRGQNKINTQENQIKN